MEIIKSQKGFLTILTGKTDMGKSTITVYDCSEQLRRGSNVIFFEYEYCQSIIYNKLVSHFGLKWQDLFKLNLVDASGLSLGMLIELIKEKNQDVQPKDFWKNRKTLEDKMILLERNSGIIKT